MVAGWSTGGRLVDHHQHLPLCLQALVDLTQPALVVGQGPLEDLPSFLAQGRGPVLTPCRRPVPMKTSMSPISIFVPPLAAWVWGQPVGRPAPHPRLR